MFRARFAARRLVRNISFGSYKPKNSDPQFVVTLENGFLPREDPLVTLPPQFKELEQLLQEMPKTTKDGREGLLMKGTFGEASAKVPLYDVDNIDDSALLCALFRDYTFWASSYLLEPCDLEYRKTKTYGLGRQVLPKNIAVPLVKIADKIGAKPFMEYALSYALYNWKRKDPQGDLNYNNLELIRAFEGSEHEHGFILVHVAMVANTGDQVRHTLSVINRAEEQNRPAFNGALRDLTSTMRTINGIMDTMWKRSSPGAYNSFRSFIMGTKNQPMFPKGVIYEGVSDEPHFYRGESGANDTIIPTCDNLLQLTEKMPKNPLTEILMDFRQYRPVRHNEWLTFVHNRAGSVGVRGFALQDSTSAVLYMGLLDQVREFRDRHWRFTKEYIIKYSNHPVATGGSPIVTWLPNQLAAVLTTMTEVSSVVKKEELNSEDAELFERLSNAASTQHRILEREVAELKERFGTF
eukprot:gene1454-1056_t